MITIGWGNSIHWLVSSVIFKLIIFKSSSSLASKVPFLLMVLCRKGVILKVPFIEYVPSVFSSEISILRDA